MTDLIGVLLIVIAAAIFIGVANIAYRTYLSNTVCAWASSAMWLCAVAGLVLLWSGNANAAKIARLESLASAMAIQKQRYWLTFSLKAARWAERLTISARALPVQIATHG